MFFVSRKCRNVEGAHETLLRVKNILGKHIGSPTVQEMFLRQDFIGARPPRLSRTFDRGQRYDPSDLREQAFRTHLAQKRKKGKQDPFALLGINPLHEYKNTRLFLPFLSEMGRIKSRFDTGLSAKNQRRVTKAIKRARAMGLLSFNTKDYRKGEISFPRSNREDQFMY